MEYVYARRKEVRRNGSFENRLGDVVVDQDKDHGTV